MAASTTYRATAMAAVAVLGAALVIAAVVLLVRGGGNAPIQVVIPAQETGAADSAVPAASGDGAASLPSPEIKVYVSGAVRDPEVYRLERGDRLVDALKAAGGAEEDAMLDLVNLSLRVVDEGHYHIPRPGETPPPSAAGPAPAFQESVAGALVDLNRAPVDVLETLPGIGPALAQAIVDYRESHEGFQSVEEITNVSRIGPITFQKIRGLVTVDPSR